MSKHENNLPQVVSQAEWQSARDKLLVKEKAATYGVVGSYIAARFAPRVPMHHALALGVVGLVLIVAGAIAMRDFGPNWYPVALVLTILPCAWIGGVLHRNKAGRTRPPIWSMQ